MLNYIEKGQGLWREIDAAGQWLRQDNRVWVCSDEQAVQAIIDAYPLSATIAEKKAEIDEYAKELRIKATGGMSPEQSSWAIKSAQAQKYSATSNPADASLLAAEAAYRGDTLQSVVDRVLANAGGLLEMEARIAGVAGKHKDSVTAMLIDNPTADDFRAVLDYDYKSDAEWPSL
jgi:hypothetical protein